MLYKTVVVDSDWRFYNLCGSRLQSKVICQLMALNSGC